MLKWIQNRSAKFLYAICDEKKLSSETVSILTKHFFEIFKVFIGFAITFSALKRVTTIATLSEEFYY